MQLLTLRNTINYSGYKTLLQLQDMIYIHLHHEIKVNYIFLQLVITATYHDLTVAKRLINIMFIQPFYNHNSLCKWHQSTYNSLATVNIHHISHVYSVHTTILHLLTRGITMRCGIHTIFLQLLTRLLTCGIPLQED